MDLFLIFCKIAGELCHPCQVVEEHGEGEDNEYGGDFEVRSTPSGMSGADIVTISESKITALSEVNICCASFYTFCPSVPLKEN